MPSRRKIVNTFMEKIVNTFMEKNSKYFLKHFVHIYTLKIDVIKVPRLVT